MKLDAQGRKLRQLWLAAGTPIDFEKSAQNQFVVTLWARDSNSPQLISNSITVTVNVTNTNERPTLIATPDLRMKLDRDVTSAENLGLAVAALLGGAADPNIADGRGIAIVSTHPSAASYGALQYSTDSGATWINVGSVSDESVLLLANEPQNRVRFDLTRPWWARNWQASFRSARWDRTIGSLDGHIRLDALRVNRSSAAVSTQVEVVALDVTPRVGDPTLVNSADTVGIQDQPTVAVDALGYSVHVWRSAGNGIVGQRISPDGTPFGDKFTVTTNASAADPHVAMNPNGGVIVVWRQLSGLDSQLYAANSR